MQRVQREMKETNLAKKMATVEMERSEAVTTEQIAYGFSTGVPEFPPTFPS